MDSLLHEKVERTLETLESARRRIMELEAELEILRGLESTGGLEMLQQQSHAIQTDQDLQKKCRRDPVRLFLANPDICHRIFANLSCQELLTCSAVNKSWYRESRTTAHQWKQCFAHVGTKKNSACLDLLNLNNFLVKFKTVPFNSLHVHLRKHDCPSLVDDSGPEDYYARLCKLEWKNVNVSWDLGVKCFHCPAVQMVRRILGKCAGQLHELSLQGVPRGAGLFADKDKDANLLPRLQVCYLKQSRLDELLPVILMVAPKLEKLYADLEINDLALFSRNRYPVVKEMRVSQGRSNLELLAAFAHSQPPPQLEQLQMVDAIDHSRSNVYYYEPLRTILTTSQNTLKILSICALELEKFVTAGLPQLQKVQKLSLAVPVEAVKDEPRQMQILLENLKLNVYFPSLKSIALTLHSCKCDPQDGTSTSGPSSETAQESNVSQVSELCIDQLAAYIPRSYLANLFPRVTTMECKFRHLDQEHKQIEHQLKDWETSSPIWGLFKHLKYLKFVAEAEFMDSLYLDPIFCGISMEEFEESKHFSGEQLERLQLVPIRPGIVYASNLKELYISFVTQEYGSPVSEENRRSTREMKHLLSEVTGYLAFGRIPSLQVTLECSSRKFGALNHLAPWANIVYKD